ILEKPDLLWDQPELDRLYARLEDEYELRERVLALERKLEVVSRAAQTMLDLHQAKRSLHVEYYIVVLIAFEIALALFELAR
ncbi:MAG: RMD1 family protein, partial [Myxococcales bacterium]|nr:RMD1 family protein [Myxococcales bacterium]